jgi:hypothetical protein
MEKRFTQRYGSKSIIKKTHDNQNAIQNYKFYIQELRHQRPNSHKKVGTIINILKINFLISANYLLAVKKLDHGLDGRSSKLNGNISVAELIKINLSTSYGYVYLMIEVRFKIGEY